VEGIGKSIFDMSHIASSSYEHEKDFEIIIDLLTKVRPPERLNDYLTKVDIEENLASESVRANTRIWFDDDQPIGWADVDDFNNLRWEMDGQYQELIGSEIVAWGETCIRNVKEATLDTSCKEDHIERITFLKRHGFQQTSLKSIQLMRSLSEPIPQPELPRGFIIRPIAGNEEAEAVASTHRAAFRTDYMTIEKRLAIMNTSEYDPSLDLVVVAPDGMISAYCTCSVNEEEKTGTTDPVATHPDYQRMGLSQALLLTGLQLLKEHGIKSAHLGTSRENLPMRKSAESIGFTVEYTTLWFSKEVK
jgi:GNAT superfamily N-acetyltransferase